MLDKTSMTTSRIVAEQQGSWKWQAAYRVAYYHIKERQRDGAVIWYSVSRSGKMSEPQIRRAGIIKPYCSAHNQVVTLSEAIKQLGEIGAQNLLDRGYKFDC